MHATQVYRNYSTGLSLYNIIHYSTTALLARFHLLSYSIPFPTSSSFFSPIRMKKDPWYHISFSFKYWSNQIIWMTHALLLKEEPQNNNFCPIIGLSHNYSNAKLRQVLILCQFCSLSFYISSELKTEEAQFQTNWSTITYFDHNSDFQGSLLLQCMFRKKVQIKEFSVQREIYHDFWDVVWQHITRFKKIKQIIIVPVTSCFISNTIHQWLSSSPSKVRALVLAACRLVFGNCTNFSCFSCWRCQMPVGCTLLSWHRLRDLSSLSSD